MKERVLTHTTQITAPILASLISVVPTSAATLARNARAAGFEVECAFTEAERYVVEGIHRGRRVGFRAYWLDGRASAASWHEARVEYRDVPAPVTKLQGAGKDRAVRPTGYVDGTRLEAVASPLGVWVGITELNKRLKG